MKLERKADKVCKYCLEGVNIKMREELFLLWQVMVYGCAGINVSCNNKVETKDALQASTEKNFKMQFKMGWKHFHSLQLRENSRI